MAGLQRSRGHQKFHSRAGRLVQLSDGERTATREHASQEFNNALIFGDGPLETARPFEVRLERKIANWSGSIEIGVTGKEPNTLDEIPATAVSLKEDTWLYSGASLLHNGSCFKEDYGLDLDSLVEGDRVGVMVTAGGQLHFTVNGEDQGAAVFSGLPNRLFPIIDLYGKCCQVSVCDPAPLVVPVATLAALHLSPGALASSTAPMRFHQRCGAQVRLDESRLAAERLNPSEEFNNAIVFSDRPMQPGDLFQVKLETVCPEKWSGGLELGVTTHCPDQLERPTMTALVVGTILLSGNTILTNGRPSLKDYLLGSLDDLKPGDTVGVRVSSAGDLHFIVNGVDAGIASSALPPVCWAVVDLYGLCSRVSISSEPHISPMVVVEESLVSEEDVEDLMFVTPTEDHVTVFDHGTAAIRMNADDEFDRALLLTNRPLEPAELFTIRVDRLLSRWRGSLEIGLTSLKPSDPSLRLVESASDLNECTWLLSESGSLVDGLSTDVAYGARAFENMEVGDRLGVKYDAAGLHFFYNDEALGVIRAVLLPQPMYAIVSLYGRVSRVALLREPAHLFWHPLTGENAHLSADGRTLSRLNATETFNSACAISRSPLQPGQPVTLTVTELASNWAGSLEVGLTLTPPDTFSFPQTLTEMDHCWLLNGSSLIVNAETVSANFSLNLDEMVVGDELSLLLTEEGDLIFSLNGQPHPAAFESIPLGARLVVNLYGLCSAVRLRRAGHGRTDRHQLQTFVADDVLSLKPGQTGQSVQRRGRVSEVLLTTLAPLAPMEKFTLQVDDVMPRYFGVLSIGVCSVTPMGPRDVLLASDAAVTLNDMVVGQSGPVRPLKPSTQLSLWSDEEGAVWLQQDNETRLVARLAPQLRHIALRLDGSVAAITCVSRRADVTSASSATAASTSPSPAASWHVIASRNVTVAGDAVERAAGDGGALLIYLMEGCVYRVDGAPGYLLVPLSSAVTELPPNPLDLDWTTALTYDTVMSRTSIRPLTDLSAGLLLTGGRLTFGELMLRSRVTHLAIYLLGSCTKVSLRDSLAREVSQPPSCSLRPSVEKLVRDSALPLTLLRMDQVVCGCPLCHSDKKPVGWVRIPLRGAVTARCSSKYSPLADYAAVRAALDTPEVIQGCELVDGLETLSFSRVIEDMQVVAQVCVRGDETHVGALLCRLVQPL